MGVAGFIPTKNTLALYGFLLDIYGLKYAYSSPKYISLNILLFTSLP